MWGAESPFKTMWPPPGPRPTCMPSFIFYLDPSNRLATVHQRHRQRGHDRQDRTGQTDNGLICNVCMRAFITRRSYSLSSHECEKHSLSIERTVLQTAPKNVHVASSLVTVYGQNGDRPKRLKSKRRHQNGDIPKRRQRITANVKTATERDQQRSILATLTYLSLIHI